MFQVYSRSMEGMQKRLVQKSKPSGLTYIAELDVYYIFPVSEFLKHKSVVNIQENVICHKTCRATPFREAWDLIK